MISAAFFAFADSVAWDHFFAIFSNEKELCSDGSQTKVTKIPAPFDFYEKLCFDTDELETFTFKAEYVDHCVVITSVPRGIHSVVPLVVGSQLRNWVKNRDLPITVSLNESSSCLPRLFANRTCARVWMQQNFRALLLK